MSESGDSDVDAEINREDVMEDTAELLSIEDHIRELLEKSISKYTRGNKKEGRKILRDFGENNKEIFDSLVYIIQSNDDFFEDAESYFDEAALKRIHSFQDDYPKIADELFIVDLEVSDDRKNPLSTYSTEIMQSSKSEDILMEYRAKSGEIDLVNTRVTIPHMAFFSESILSGMIDVLNNIKGYNISQEDIEEIREATETFEEDIAQMRELLDTIENEKIPSGDDE